jgi:hypothetical protein
LNAPATLAAILLAYNSGTDREIVPMLQDVFVSGDTPTLDFLQTAAHKLQAAGYLSYVRLGQQRVMTLRGKQAAAEIKMTMLKQHGQLSDMALIRTLAPQCINELIAWHAENVAPAWEQIERTATAALMEK